MSQDPPPPDDRANVDCAYCGKVIARDKALTHEWYGERAYLCSRDCLIAREHRLTDERDDEATGE